MILIIEPYGKSCSKSSTQCSCLLVLRSGYINLEQISLAKSKTRVHIALKRNDQQLKCLCKDIGSLKTSHKHHNTAYTFEFCHQILNNTRLPLLSLELSLSDASAQNSDFLAQNIAILEQWIYLFSKIRGLFVKNFCLLLCYSLHFLEKIWVQKPAYLHLQEQIVAHSTTINLQHGESLELCIFLHRFQDVACLEANRF